MLHAAQVSFFMDPEGRHPEVLLEAWRPLVEVAEAAAQAGVRVSVVQASSHSLTVSRGGVEYHFLPFGDEFVTSPRRSALAELLGELVPDVFHVHGLSFSQEIAALGGLAGGSPIIAQDHADRLPRIWRRAAWRRSARVMSGVSFCSREQADPFLEAGLLSGRTRIYEIPESSSRFTPGDREAARRATGAHGDPLVLSVGHLDRNKDPLAVLAGISEATERLPHLQMWCCFGAAPLAREVERFVASDERLGARVHLLGPVPHERVEQLMRAADLFVQGSHRESTGFALIEALACGLTPIVTDIPSFRSLTSAGAVGRLWPCGQPRALAEALVSVAGSLCVDSRKRVRAYFDRELSFHAIGTRLAAMYQDAVARSNGRRDHREPAADASIGLS